MSSQTAGQQQAIQRSQRGEPLSSVDVFNLRSMGMGTGGGASSVTTGQKAAIAALQNAGGDTSQLTDVQRFNIARFQEQQGGVISSDAQGNYYLSAQPYVNPTPQTQSGISQPVSRISNIPSANVMVTPISRYQQLAQTAQTYLRTNIPYVSPVIQRVYEAPERARERGFMGGYNRVMPYGSIIRFVQNPSETIQTVAERVIPLSIQKAANIQLSKIPYIETVAPITRDIAGGALSFELLNPEGALLSTSKNAIKTMYIKPTPIPKPEPNIDFFAKVDDSSLTLVAKSKTIGQEPSYIIGKYAILKNPISGEPIGLLGKALNLEPKTNAVKVTLSDALAANTPIQGTARQVTKANDLLFTKSIKDIDASVSMGLNVQKGTATYPTLGNRIKSKVFDVMGLTTETQKSAVAGITKPINENTFSYVGGSAKMRIAKDYFFNKKIVFKPRIRGLIRSTAEEGSEGGTQVLRFVKSNFPTASLDQAAKQSVKQMFTPVTSKTALSTIDRSILGNAKPLTKPLSFNGKANTASQKQTTKENAKFFTASPQSISISQRYSQITPVSAMNRIKMGITTKYKQPTIVSTSQSDIERQETRQRTNLMFNQPSAQSQSQRQEQRISQRYLQTPKAFYPNPTPPPKVPPPLIPSIRLSNVPPRLLRRPKNISSNDIFTATTRRHGKEILVARGIDAGKVLGIGKAKALTTLAASVKLYKNNKPVPIAPDVAFRQSKSVKNPFALVQRSGREGLKGGRLSSFGERREIQASKAARRIWGFKKK